MPDVGKYKSLNVDHETHYYLRCLAAATDQSIVKVVRTAIRGLTIPAYAALVRANRKRLVEQEARQKEKT